MIKRFISVLLILMVIICGAPAIFAIDDDTELIPWWDFQQGDVNLDTKVNIKDATLIQKHLAKLSSLSEHQLVFADVDGKEGVSIKDTTHLQKWLAGLTDELFGVEVTVPATTESLVITTSNMDESTFSKSTESITQPESEILSTLETTTQAAEASSVVTDSTEVSLPSSEATETTEITEATEASSTAVETSEAEKTEFTGIITLPFVPAI